MIIGSFNAVVRCVFQGNLVFKFDKGINPKKADPGSLKVDFPSESPCSPMATLQEVQEGAQQSTAPFKKADLILKVLQCSCW